MQKGSSTIGYKIFGTDSSSGGIVHRGWGLIAIFRNSFASTSEIFILSGGAGRWAIILWGLETFLIYPNFVGS